LKKKKSTPRAKAKTASSKKRATGSSDAPLRQHLVDLLKGGSAHVHFMDALDDFPPNKRGTFAQGLPHTGWQLLEHSRIAQWDIRDFPKATGRKRRVLPAKQSGRKARRRFRLICAK
jgi:hypothetical protein